MPMYSLCNGSSQCNTAPGAVMIGLSTIFNSAIVLSTSFALCILGLAVTASVCEIAMVLLLSLLAICTTAMPLPGSPNPVVVVSIPSNFSSGLTAANMKS